MQLFTYEQGQLIHRIVLNMQFNGTVAIETTLAFAFCLSLVPIAWLDLKTRYIPDRFVITSASLAWLHAYVRLRQNNYPIYLSILIPLVSACITSIPFWILFFIRDDIGGADAKMAAVCGCLAGIECGLRLLFLSFALTITAVIFYRIWQGLRRKQPIRHNSKTATYPLLPGICIFLFLFALSLIAL